MDAALAGCDIVACHGVATASAALAAGKPVLHRLCQPGLGTGAEQVEGALAALLDDPGYPARATAFAWRYRGHSPDRSAQKGVAVCVGALPC